MKRFKAVWQIDQDSPWVSYYRAADEATAIRKVKSAYDGSAHITFVSLHGDLDACIYSEGNFKPFWNEEMPTKMDDWDRPYPKPFAKRTISA
jgi:hypothetical protein